MKKLTILSLLSVLIILAGCNTYKKQLGTFQAFAMQNTNELAKLCSTVFPVKDSIGAVKIDSTHKAVNVNYKSSLDSLAHKADSLKKELAKDTAKSNPCANIARGYQIQIIDLTNSLQQLRHSYKACQPDTVYKSQTIFKTDQAALAVINKAFQVKSDSLNISNHDLTNEQSESKSRLKWIFILSGVLVALGIVTVLKFLGKLGI